MTGRSSTSSSSGLLLRGSDAPLPAAAPSQGDESRGFAAAISRARSLASLARRLPRGALAGAAVVVVVHVVVNAALPYPIAREQLRSKVLTLTERGRPRLVFAGDSRAAHQLMPTVVTSQLGYADTDAANIALDNCGSTPVLAAYREFSHRFAPSPIMVISISIWSVNDEAATILRDDELLWALSPFDRLRVVPAKRAFVTTFLREKWLLKQVQNRLWQAVATLFTGNDAAAVPTAPDRGYASLGVGTRENFSPDAIERLLEMLHQTWYAGPELNGVRWRQLELNLQTLLRADVQVVLFDGPEHPLLLERMTDTAAGRANENFHEKLADLAKRLDVPLLRYRNDWHPRREANEVFFDVLHVNHQGATLLSRRMAKDLRAMMESGLLRQPPVGATPNAG